MRPNFDIRGEPLIGQMWPMADTENRFRALASNLTATAQTIIIDHLRPGQLLYQAK